MAVLACFNIHDRYLQMHEAFCSMTSQYTNVNLKTIQDAIASFYIHANSVRVSDLSIKPGQPSFGDVRVHRASAVVRQSMLAWQQDGSLEQPVHRCQSHAPNKRWTTAAGDLKPKTVWSLSGVPDYFDRNKISSGGDLSHYSSASLY